MARGKMSPELTNDIYIDSFYTNGTVSASNPVIHLLKTCSVIWVRN